MPIRVGLLLVIVGGGLSYYPSNLVGQQSVPTGRALDLVGSFSAQAPQDADPDAGSATSPTFEPQLPAAGSVLPPATQDVAAQLAVDPIAALASQIEQRRAQVALPQSGIPDDLKETLTALYQDALTQLAALQSAQSETARYEQMIASASSSVDRVQESLENLQQQPKPVVPRPEDLREGKEQQQTLSAELSKTTGELRDFEVEQSRRSQRKQEIPVDIAKLRTRLDELQKKPTIDDTGKPEQAIEAGRWYQSVALQTVQAQVRKLELEAQAYEAESTLLPAQIDLARRIETRLKEQVQQISTQLEALRSNHIKQSKYDAQDLLTKTAVPEARQQVQELLVKIDRWEALAKQHVDVQVNSKVAQETLDTWRGRLMSLKDQSRGGELNSWVGLKLRRQQSELPDKASLRRDIETVRSQLRDAEAIQFEMQDSQREARRQIERIERESSAPPGPGSKSKAEIEQLLAVLTLRQTVGNAIETDTRDLIDDLIAAATTRQETIDLVVEYKDFIEKHILWIRSAQPLAVGDFTDSWQAANWFVSRPNLQAVGELFRTDVRDSFWWYGLFFASMAVLIMNRPGMSQLLARLSQQAQKRGCSDFRLTARALLLTMLLASPVAIILLFAHWRLAGSPMNRVASAVEASDYINAISMAFLYTALVLFPIAFSRQVSQPHGLGVKHFGWSESLATTCRSGLKWLIWVGLPLVFLTSAMCVQSDSRKENSLGRLAFVALMLLLMVFLMRVVHPTRGCFAGHIKSHPNGWLERTSWLWYTGICLVPVAIAVTSTIGFQYTAVRIAIHLNSTIVMLVTLTIAYGLLARWLLLNRRKLMLARARARLEEAARREAHLPVPITDVPDIDMVEINEQTRRLVTSLIVATGIGATFAIWSDVLPAVEILNRFVIWEVDGNSPEENANITLANLVLLVPVLVLMVIAGRNVPGLLEIGLLQHLPLSTAARYAVTTLFRYAIFAFGITAAGWIVGLQWSSIQWLVAALGVGLGFGLQEIFANFVSGVILLFEQPLRVGDIVSIDGTTGTVSKIRMRATTIVNWDRQELIVPNKELITGKLLNWTLSDTTNRIVVDVGVAYGSDMKEACAIISNVCEEHPNIMTDPRPVITFSGFGDNTLNIVVRAYLSSLDNRLATIHEIHQQVYEALAHAEIEIAFPQRDMHIRSLPDKLSSWLDSK